MAKEDEFRYERYEIMAGTDLTEQEADSFSAFMQTIPLLSEYEEMIELEKQGFPYTVGEWTTTGTVEGRLIREKTVFLDKEKFLSSNILHPEYKKMIVSLFGTVRDPYFPKREGDNTWRLISDSQARSSRQMFEFGWGNGPHAKPQATLTILRVSPRQLYTMEFVYYPGMNVLLRNQKIHGFKLLTTIEGDRITGYDAYNCTVEQATRPVYTGRSIQINDNEMVYANDIEMLMCGIKMLNADVEQLHSQMKNP